MIGKTLGHYRITEKLGEGGMGVVYKARDTHLDRFVAIKALPADKVADCDRKRRFVQEAKAASALNHPNIIHIYDISSDAGHDFIAMEYVGGKPLDQLISPKGMPLSLVLKYAVQIGDALSGAHEAGIIHRDLKPSNVMVEEHGLVKVLDFGLAKLTEAAGSEAETITTRTADGTIVGTAAYMSPEQAEGKPVDARSDIFSFGAVLYEMLTGQKAFRGESRIATLSAVLHQEPKPLENVPHDLVMLVTRCLRKDRERRAQHMADVRLALQELKEESDSGKSSAVAPAPGHVRRWIPRVAAALGMLLATAIVVTALRYWLPKTGQEPGLASASFTQLTNQSGEEYYPSLSPDGRSMVYASPASGNWDIYLQRVGGQNPVNLTRDCAEDDIQPAFSPDGEAVAFRSDRDGGGIYVMGTTGESPKRLTDFGTNPAWSPDGREIVFASQGFVIPSSRGPLSELWIVTVSTNQVRKVSVDLGDAVQPAWSPHGHRIAFWSIRTSDGSTGRRDIWTVPVAGGEALRVTNDPAVDWNPVWSPDGKSLYFSSDRGGSMNLWRVPIDEETGKTQGEPRSVTTGGGSASRQHVSVSRDGRRVAFVERIARRNIQKVAFDPTAERIMGQPVWITRGSRQDNWPDPSPDGAWVAFASIGAPQEDLAVIRTDGTGERRITNDAARDRVPRWSPDGKRIMFYSNRLTERWQVWAINPDGSGLQKLGETEQSVQWPTWSPDGRRVAYGWVGSSACCISELGKPWKDHTERLPELSEAESFALSAWSPDGKWLCGGVIGKRSSASTVSGTAVYSFETRRFEKLTNFGGAPIWLSDSRRLIFPHGQGIYLVDRTSRKVRPITLENPYPIFPAGFRVSRDDRTIYYAVDINEADIWLMTLQ